MPRSPAEASREAPADPLHVGVDAAFRVEVGRLRARDQRRRFPAEVHVGFPAGARVWLEPPAAADRGLRFDLLGALIDVWRETDGGPAFGWIARPGVPEVHDEDLAWYAAAVRAFGAHGEAPLGFRAVTRSGWLDVVTGESRVWKRLRLDRSG